MYPLTCPNCGNVNRPTDTYCPRCNATLRPKSSMKGLWFLIIPVGILVLAVGAYIRNDSKLREARRQEEKRREDNYVRINPSIRVTEAGVIATNNEDYTYPRFTVILNPNGSSGGFSAEYGDLGPGKTAVIPFSKFANADGRRFNISTNRINQLSARAWPNGLQSTHTFDFKEN